MTAAGAASSDVASLLADTTRTSLLSSYHDHEDARRTATTAGSKSCNSPSDYCSSVYYCNSTNLSSSDGSVGGIQQSFTSFDDSTDSFGAPQPQYNIGDNLHSKNENDDSAIISSKNRKNEDDEEESVRSRNYRSDANNHVFGVGGKNESDNDSNRGSGVFEDDEQLSVTPSNLQENNNISDEYDSIDSDNDSSFNEIEQ
ncbi:MAG: hypothetical protein ACREBR_04270, partial [bacterium]